MIRTPISIIFCTSVALVGATLPLAVPAAPGGYEMVTTVGADGKLEGCGVRVSRSDGASATITLHRQDMRGDAGAVELSASLPGVAAPPATIALITTNAGEIGGFVIGDAKDAMPIQASAHVEPDAAAMLMHDVLLQGVSLSIDGDRPSAVATTFDGPATPDIIRAYLQCAGNMGR